MGIHWHKVIIEHPSPDGLRDARMSIGVHYRLVVLAMLSADRLAGMEFFFNVFLKPLVVFLNRYGSYVCFIQ